MTQPELSRFIQVCRRAAGTHPYPELCLNLAMKAQDRLTMRRLNETLSLQGYNIGTPLILNGHHG